MKGERKISASERKATARDRKRTPRMHVSGKSVFKLAEIRDKPKKKR